MCQSGDLSSNPQNSCKKNCVHSHACNLGEVRGQIKEELGFSGCQPNSKTSHRSCLEGIQQKVIMKDTWHPPLALMMELGGETCIHSLWPLSVCVFDLGLPRFAPGCRPGSATLSVMSHVLRD